MGFSVCLLISASCVLQNDFITYANYLSLKKTSVIEILGYTHAVQSKMEFYVMVKQKTNKYEKYYRT